MQLSNTYRQQCRTHVLRCSIRVPAGYDKTTTAYAFSCSTARWPSKYNFARLRGPICWAQRARRTANTTAQGSRGGRLFRARPRLDCFDEAATCKSCEEELFKLREFAIARLGARGHGCGGRCNTTIGAVMDCTGKEAKWPPPPTNAPDGGHRSISTAPNVREYRERPTRCGILRM